MLGWPDVLGSVLPSPSVLSRVKGGDVL